MHSPYDLVKEFHEAMGLPVRDKPQGHLPYEEASLRIELLREEVDEYTDAALSGTHLQDILSELADVVYVAYGTALTYGVDLDAAIDEIHKANMRKLWADGRPRYREDGKVLKSPNYYPADLSHLV
jgi:predicted HAD superfamily Cof-like phosphohydrolase